MQLPYKAQFGCGKFDRGWGLLMYGSLALISSWCIVEQTGIVTFLGLFRWLMAYDIQSILRSPSLYVPGLQFSFFSLN